MWELIAKVVTVEAAAFLGMIFGFVWEEKSQKRRRKRERERAMNERLNMAVAGRLARERHIMSILHENVAVEKKEPIRKVCGIFGTPEAQELLK